jgi:hypothetical protein
MHNASRNRLLSHAQGAPLEKQAAQTRPSAHRGWAQCWRHAHLRQRRRKWADPLRAAQSTCLAVCGAPIAQWLLPCTHASGQAGSRRAHTQRLADRGLELPGGFGNCSNLHDSYNTEHAHAL